MVCMHFFLQGRHTAKNESMGKSKFRIIYIRQVCLAKRESQILTVAGIISKVAYPAYLLYLVKSTKFVAKWVYYPLLGNNRHVSLRYSAGEHWRS